METMAMKLTSGLFVVSIIVPALAISLAAPLNASLKSKERSLQRPLPISPTEKQRQNTPNILFFFNKATSDQAILQANALWLKDHPSVRVRLAGYSDPRGDIVYNLLLSQKRAETVKQQLVAMGVGESRIVFATGWGELYPKCLETTEECWKQNRRVEFLLAIY